MVNSRSRIKLAIFLVSMITISACATTAADVPGKPGGWLVEELRVSSEADLRLAIIREMATRRDSSLLPYLCAATADNDARVRQAAMEGLVDYGGALNDGPRDDSYLRGLEDRVHAIREIALVGIRARFRDDRVPANLKSALQDLAKNAEDYRLRLASIRILSTVEGEDVDALMLNRAKEDDHSDVRRAAARALGTRGVSSARKLLNQLRNKDMVPGVRSAAEEALAAIGGVVSEDILVVMPFDTRSRKKDVRSFTKGLQDFLSGALAKANLATVVERRQIDRAMDELIFQDDHIDDGKAVEVGKFLRANHVLTGTVQLNGNQLTVVAKRIDVVTGTIVQSIQVHGRVHDADALQQDAAHELVRTFQ